MSAGVAVQAIEVVRGGCHCRIGCEGRGMDGTLGRPGVVVVVVRHPVTLVPLIRLEVKVLLVVEVTRRGWHMRGETILHGQG